MNKDLTEMFYPWEMRRVRKDRGGDKFWPMFFVLVVLFLLAFAVDTFHLTDERIGVETAHASSVEEVHQNDYYCGRIKSGFYPNVGTGKGITELCAKWGVNLND